MTSEHNSYKIVRFLFLVCKKQKQQYQHPTSQTSTQQHEICVRNMWIVSKISTGKLSLLGPRWCFLSNCRLTSSQVQRARAASRWALAALTRASCIQRFPLGSAWHVLATGQRAEKTWHRSIPLRRLWLKAEDYDQQLKLKVQLTQIFTLLSDTWTKMWRSECTKAFKSFTKLQQIKWNPEDILINKSF